LAQASSLSPPGAVLVATRRTADADGADRFAADLACAGKGPVLARALRRDQVVGRTRQDSLDAGTDSLRGYRRVRSGAGSAGALECYQFGNEPYE
jgi:hypothetical protein